MRRLSALLLPLLAVLAGLAVVTLAAPGTERCLAQATSDPEVEARISCPDAAAGGAGPPSGSGVVVGAGGSAGAGTSAGTGSGAATGAGAGAAPPVCVVAGPARSVTATRRGRGLRFGYERRGAGPLTVDVFRVSAGSRILGNRRVARFANRRGSFSWTGRGSAVGDGAYVARFTARGAETRRVALRRRDGRFSARPAFELPTGCGALRTAKLERPVFGGRTNRALGISYRLNRAARVTVTVTRAGRVVRRFRTTSDRPGTTYRLRLAPERLRRGDHLIRFEVRSREAPAATARLTAARL